MNSYRVHRTYEWIKESDENTVKSFLSCVEIKNDALHIIIQENKMEVLRFLLTQDLVLNIDHQDHNGDSPLHIAAETNNTRALELLLSHKAKMNCLNNLGLTPMLVALVNKHMNIVNALLEEARKRSMDIVNDLLEDGQKRPQKDAVVYKKYRQVCKLILNQESVDRLGSFLSENKGIDIDFKELKGIESPLVLAVAVGSFGVVEALLESGADVNNRREGSSMSALHVAIRPDRVVIADLLLEYGADVNCCSSKESLISPVLCAIKITGRVLLKMLLERGALVNFPGELESALHLAVKLREAKKCKLLINFGADIDRVNEEGKTPLYLATSDRNVDMIELLLVNKANPNIADNDGITPFLLMCRKYDDYSGNFKIGKKLINHGADTDVQNKRGSTALHFLRDPGHYEFAKFLLEEGLVSDVNHKNMLGRVPIGERFYKNCREDILLLRYGADINIAINSAEIASLMPRDYQEIEPDDEPFNNLNCPVYAHFKQIKLLGYKVNDLLWSKYQEMVCSNHAFEDSTIQIADFEVELEQLKTTEIHFDPQKTLYDVLLMKQHEVTSICSSKEFENLYRQNDNEFENSYPHYGWLLNLQYRRGHRRRKLMDSVAEILETALGLVEPDLLSWILRYLKDYDLKQILKSERK